MFCGACGTRNEDGAVRCCNCGAFLPGAVNPRNVSSSSPVSNAGNNNVKNNYNDGYNNYTAPNQNVSYQVIQPMPSVKNGGAAKTILKFLLIFVLAAVLVVGGIAVYALTDYRATINYFEYYFDHYQYSKIVDMYSYATFYDANSDSNYAELDAETKLKLENIFEYFDDELGDQNYPLKFKTLDNHIMTDDEYDEFMNSLDYPDKDKVIKNARIAEIKITATLDGKNASKNVKLILTLEEHNNKNEWSIYSFEEI